MVTNIALSPAGGRRVDGRVFSMPTLSAEIENDYIPLTDDSRDAYATPMPMTLKDLLETIQAQKFPPVERWEPDFCGDIDMRIAADGSWHYRGSLIARERMVRLFSTVLRKDGDGKTYLVTPVEKLRITVDDAPFVAVTMDRTEDAAGTPLIHFTTNVGDHVLADAEHPIRVETDPVTGEPRPYVRVRGRLDALIARSVFYDLVALAEPVEEAGTTFLDLYSAGTTFRLGAVDA